MNIYDLVIIGAGPAGITAAVYAARKRMKFLVITRDIGGQAALSGDVGNYTGYQFISGPELAVKFAEHMQSFGIELKESEEVTSLEKKEDAVNVKTDKGAYYAKTAVIASGKRSRELGVPGEKEFKNRGLTYCATCDGPLFSKKDVAVVGGGNSALDAALQLERIANKIYLINITQSLTGDPVMREKVSAAGNVFVMNSTKVVEIFGDKVVRGMVIEKGDERDKLPVEGIFVEIGLVPNSDFVTDIEKNELGEIKVNSRNETDTEGVFAAGDVTDVPEKQIIIAAGEGAKAVLSAFKYLARKRG